MDKLKGNLFWVAILAVLVAELVLYVVMVRGTASATDQSIEELAHQKRQIDSIQQKAVNAGLIEAAAAHKQNLEREYTRMALFLIDKDDNLDKFGPDSRLAPSQVLNLSGRQRAQLGDTLVAKRQKMERESVNLRIVPPPPATQPWDFVTLTGDSSEQVYIYAYKQLWVQEELLRIIRQPATAHAAIAPAEAAPPAEQPPAREAEAAEANKAAAPPPRLNPLVTSLNKVEFFLPRKEELFDPLNRYTFHNVNVRVTMYANDVPVLLERILKSDLPLMVDSYKISKSMMDTRSVATVAGRPTSGLVDVQLALRVLDMTMGIGEVIFSAGKFTAPADVEAYLENHTDPAMAVIRRQIKKPGVSPSVRNGEIRYRIYGDPQEARSLLDAGRALVKCEIESGVTVVHGRLVVPLPETKN